jgi:hypothetical protein
LCPVVTAERPVVEDAFVVYHIDTSVDAIVLFEAMHGCKTLLCSSSNGNRPAPRYTTAVIDVPDLFDGSW